MKKRISIFAAVLASLICLCAVAGCTISPKTFEKAGMQITLTTAFYEKEMVSQTAYYESRTAVVVALKEEFSSLPGASDYTLSDYTDLVISGNRISAETHTREGKGYEYFTYEKTVSGNDYFYLATTHKTDDAFWLIQFGCFTKNKDNKTETFLEWADTITFVA